MTARQMIPAQRRAAILEVIRRSGAESIAQLVEDIGASPSTIRRDLDCLTQQGFLERSHGGAVAHPTVRTTFEPDPEIGAHISSAAKSAIGAEGARLVQDGLCVMFDSSSTVYEAAKRIARSSTPITAVTNDLRIASSLALSAAVSVVVLGGTVRRNSFTLVGDPGLEFIDGIRVDLALMGIHSLAELRLSETSIEVAMIKRRMIRAARSVALLVDSGKFDHPSFCEVCSVSEVNIIISDTGLRASTRDSLEAQGVEVRLVDPRQEGPAVAL